MSNYKLANIYAVTPRGNIQTIKIDKLYVIVALTIDIFNKNF